MQQFGLSFPCPSLVFPVSNSAEYKPGFTHHPIECQKSEIDLYVKLTARIPPRLFVLDLGNSKESSPEYGLK
jgi:hypothetical protein